MKLRVPSDYTGYYGTVEFKDGISVRMVSPKEANLLKAVMAGVQVMEDDGLTVDEALDGLSVIYPLDMYTIHGNPSPSKYLTNWLGEYPAEPEVQTFGKPELDPVQIQQGTFTKEELEEIADKKGIAGLREIGNPLEVKANSIPKLIDAILAAQTPSTPQDTAEAQKAAAEADAAADAKEEKAE